MKYSLKTNFPRIILTISLISALSGCGGGSGDSGGFTNNKKTELEGCPGNLTCDYLSVPMDYSNPQSGHVKVFYGMHRATNPSERLGILLVNFGGPGADAVPGVSNMVESWLPSTIIEKFDIIGIDPRGTGSSAFAKELTECAVAGSCEDTYRQYARYLGSNSVIKDMDMLREKLGEEEINFLGYSYGTRLGSLYAAAFPDRVRAIVLDSPMAPKSDNYADIRIGNAKGYDLITDYRLGSMRRKKKLEQVSGELYSAGYYVDSYNNILSRPEGDTLLDYLVSRESQGLFGRIKRGLFGFLDYDNLGEFNYTFSRSLKDSFSSDDLRSEALFKAVVCTDERLPVELNEMAGYLDSFKQSSAVFGEKTYQENIGMCVNWPGVRDPIEYVENMEQVLTGQQILIIGGQYDPATPYRWAEQMKQSFGYLASTTTVSNRVDHGFSYTGLTCVDDQTTAYLLDPAQSLPDVSCDGTYTTPYSLFGSFLSDDEHPAKSVRGF